MLQEKVKYTLYIGSGTDAQGNTIPIWKAVSERYELNRQAAKLFGGYTDLEQSGGWVNADGVLVNERGYQLQVITDHGTAGHEKALALAESARKLFGQYEVWLTSEVVTLEVVGQ
jgi:hypothetical protein